MLSDSVSWWNNILTLQQRGLALKQMTDMQPCSKVLMQGRLFSHGETSLFCTLEPHPLNCKRTHAISVKETTHTSYMWWHLAFAACSGHTLWSAGLHNAQQCNATSQLVVFTNATQHTWPHPTVLLGVVSGATDLNLSTHRGQCNNFVSIHDLVWSCS